MNQFPGAIQYPVNKSSASVLKPTVLLVVHITGNSALPDALGEAKYSNRDGSTASFEFVTNRDGSIVQCMDPATRVSWTTGSLNAPNLALPTIKAMVGSSYGPNFFIFAQCENVGFEPGSPITAAQIATMTRLAAWGSKISGLPINRNTVLGHRDFNSVDRHNCPTSGDLAALLAKVINGANALLAPKEETTMTPISGAAYKLVVNKKTSTIATPSNFREDRFTDAVIIKPFPTGTVFFPVASASDGTNAGGTTPTTWYGGFLYSDHAPTGVRFGWFHSGVLGPLVDIVVPSGSSAADQATIADLTAKLSAAQAQAATAQAAAQSATQQATVATGRITEIKAAKVAESKAEVNLSAAETALDATIAK